MGELVPLSPPLGYYTGLWKSIEKHLLANEEDVNGTEIEIVIKGKRGKTFISCVLAGIELDEIC